MGGSQASHQWLSTKCITINHHVLLLDTSKIRDRENRIMICKFEKFENFENSQTLFICVHCAKMYICVYIKVNMNLHLILNSRNVKVEHLKISLRETAIATWTLRSDT